MNIDDLTKTITTLPIGIPAVGGFYAGIVVNGVKNYDLIYNYYANYFSSNFEHHFNMFISSMEYGGAGAITGLAIFSASKLYRKLKKN